MSKTQPFVITDEAGVDELAVLLKDVIRSFGNVTVDVGTEKTRTPTQNNCLHDFCESLAVALNDAGYDMVILLSALSKKTEIPWTKTSVKERLWKPVQEAMTNKESTTKATTKEYQEVYETLCRVLSNAAPGVHVEWPTRFNR